MTCEFAVRVLRFDGRTPVYEFSKSAVTHTEVLGEQPPDYIRVLRRADLDAVMRDYFEATAVQAAAATDSSPASLSARMEASRYVAITAAFDVLAEYEGRSVRLGSLIVRKQDVYGSWRSLDYSCELIGPLPGRVSIVLRSNTEVAMETLDIVEIWGGELRFDAVAVERAGSPGP